MNFVEKDRNAMAELFEGVGAEIGVADGNYAAIILSNPSVVKLFGVDLYKPHEGYRDYTRGTTFNNMYKHSKEKLSHFGKRHKFIYQLSMDAVKTIADNSLDFVYIDANHDYKHVMEDITEWSKKVRSGGIIAGDDYDRRNDHDMRYDVINAVNDYVTANHIIDLMIYTEGDTPNNWMFIKP